MKPFGKPELFQSGGLHTLHKASDDDSIGLGLWERDQVQGDLSMRYLVRVACSRAGRTIPQ